MGVLYTVWPVDAQAQEWLRSQAIPFPATSSRWPTRQEVEQVLKELAGFKIELTLNGPGHTWDAFITDGEEDEGNWTLLHAAPQDNNDDCTHIHFEKGEPTLIIAILRSLSALTGPFMLLPDVGGPPIVVCTARSVAEIAVDLCDVDESSAKWQRLVRGAPGAAPTVGRCEEE